MLQIIAKENDKTRISSTYIPKMDLNLKNPKVSKSKIVFYEDHTILGDLEPYALYNMDNFEYLDMIPP